MSKPKLTDLKCLPKSKNPWGLAANEKYVIVCGAQVVATPLLKAKPMCAKFHGKCVRCKLAFPKVTPIAWAKGSGAAHLSCEYRHLAYHNYTSPQVREMFLFNAQSVDRVMSELMLLFDENKLVPNLKTCVEDSTSCQAHVWGCKHTTAPWNVLLGSGG